MAMTVPNARERLNRLVELAGQSGVAARGALATELADLLLDWPQAYPIAMREPFEALLEKAVRDVEPAARSELAARLVESPDTPLTILNLLMFDAVPEIKTAILRCNARAGATRPGTIRIGVEELSLLAAMRAAAPPEFGQVLATRCRIHPAAAAQMVADESGYLLAVLCRAAGTTRATFSALAVLTRPNANAETQYRRLAMYDAVPDEGPDVLLDFWRAQVQSLEPAAKAA
jgi:uncharacterized protein (DUF2336 family)